ncbi:MAG: hypothetical protein J7518_20400 [Nocardioidaceae bacterium]|nr:hypothetical protein [Nocardioidaceae bacterium]
MHKAAVWVAGIGTLVVIDAALDRRHDGSTLSECTRLIYHTDTAVGRCAFLASWAGFVTWFPVHILRRR